MAGYQYIYTMQGLSKIYPGGREVVKDVTLAFLPGAKIGVLGVNGAGKSTLMKIMAGLDNEFSGEAWSAEGATVGYLPQEPELDATKSVKDNVLSGMGDVTELLARFEEISLKFAEPMEDDEMNALIEEQGKLQEKIDAVDGWAIEHKIDVAMDVCAVQLVTRTLGNCRGANDAGWHYVGCSCRSPIYSFSMSPPIISMPSLLLGSSVFFMSMRVRWLLSPMIAIFSIMSLDGF